MLTLLTLPLVLCLNTIVLEDGQFHLLNENDLNQGDQLIVRGGPPNMQATTRVSIGGAALFESLTLMRNGEAVVRDQSVIEGDVSVGFRGSLLLNGNATVDGGIFFAAGSSGEVRGMANVEGGTEQEASSALEVFGAVFGGNVTLRGRSTFRLSSIEGEVSVLDDADARFRSVDLEGSLAVDGSAFASLMDIESDANMVIRGTGRVDMHDTEWNGEITVQNEGLIRFFPDNTVTSVVRLLGNARMVVVTEAANVPAGAVSALTGVIIGMNPDGTTSSFAFERDPGTTLTVSTGSNLPIGMTFCSQSIPNSTGAVAHIEAFGNDISEVGILRLQATQMPFNSTSFFFLGTAPAFVSIPNGEVCIGGNVGRLQQQIMSSGQTASISLELDIFDLPGNPNYTAMPGDTLVFQAWMRDSDAGSPTFRFSDARTVQLR